MTEDEIHMRALREHEDDCRARGVCIYCEGEGILYAYVKGDFDNLVPVPCSRCKEKT